MATNRRHTMTWEARLTADNDDLNLTAGQVIGQGDTPDEADEFAAGWLVDGELPANTHYELFAA